jgi:phenylalanyl-tRNA synthetase alpha chain
MTKELETLYRDFSASLTRVTTQAALYDLKADYVGKKGHLNEILKSLKDSSEEDRKTVGARANQLKDSILADIDRRLSEIEIEEINSRLSRDRLDLSFTDSLRDSGAEGAGFHPVTIIQREIEDIFISMGFDILDGPYIEDEYHNFEALNIPADHPARDMQDTFWFRDMKHLLRTHTSTIQVRGMGKKEPPFKFVGPGKVFRCEAIDASHEAAFHQLEGMMVGREITVAHLIYFMKTLLKEIFRKDVEVRLRPGFFPFVEPGFELDINCLICGGKGCSVCKHSGWVELLPCGMVHPNVLKCGGIDTEIYNGFAFGLGLDRLVMMRYGIDDIRLLHSGNLQFISQFRQY